MADLTPLDEKLAEVLGLAQAAQKIIGDVTKMEDAEQFADQLERMRTEAADAEQRTDALIDGLEGRKTAIREMALETKGEATDMASTYLEGEEEALDGFEFLSMSEAGELCHWEIVEKMADTLGDSEVLALARAVLPAQRAHIETVREASLVLAVSEAQEG